MTRRRKLALLLVPPLAFAPALAPAAHAARPPAAAVELAAAESAHAAAIAAVRAAPGWTGPRHSPHAAVAHGLDQVGGALAEVRAAFAARDAALPRALRRGSMALAGLRVAWSRSGLAAPAAARRLRDLAVAYDRLRARCGAEGARAARGGGLSPAERRHLSAVQAARRGLAAELAPLHAAAARQGERALAGDLQRWIAQSERLAAAPASIEVLLEAVWLADLLHGEWTATAPYVPPPARGDWLAAHAAVEEVLGTSEVGYLAVADLGGGAEPLRVEPATTGGDEEEPVQRVELQVLAPEPDVLFPPQDPEEGWEAEDEGAETAAAAEEESGEETDAEAPEPETNGEESATEPTTIEVVDESGEVVTIELTKDGEPAPEPSSPEPLSDPPAASEPPPAEPPAQPL